MILISPQHRYTKDGLAPIPTHYWIAPAVAMVEPVYELEDEANMDADVQDDEEGEEKGDFEV